MTLRRCANFLNSGSPVTTDASNLRAVATAKQSAYEMAYSALISEADKRFQITPAGRYEKFFSFAGTGLILIEFQDVMGVK